MAALNKNQIRLVVSRFRDQCRTARKNVPSLESQQEKFLHQYLKSQKTLSTKVRDLVVRSLLDKWVDEEEVAKILPGYPTDDTDTIANEIDKLCDDLEFELTMQDTDGYKDLVDVFTKKLNEILRREKK